MEERLKSYFKEIGFGDVISVVELTDGSSSNHLNYKVATADTLHVARVVKPGDLLGCPNLSDEYTLLKLIEKHNVGPRVFRIDLEHFDTPILVEEFIDGTPYKDLKNTGGLIFEQSIDLLARTSEISLNQNEFPFKFAYTTYRTNFRMWGIRLGEITKFLGDGHFLVNEFKTTIDSVRKTLEAREVLLKESPKEFIYNDVHPGNTFWLPKENKAKFIDWQKVSIGDPAFMIALFARRFGHLWNLDNRKFAEKVFGSYAGKKQIINLEKLFNARILERAASDMIWSVWALLKKGEKMEITNISENKYYNETKELLARV